MSNRNSPSYDEDDVELFESSYEEYDDDDEVSDQNDILECQFFKYKDLKSVPKAALEALAKVIEMQGGTKCEWGFKALNEMVKIHFDLKQREEMVSKYKELLTYMKEVVSRNDLETAINSIIAHIPKKENSELLKELYDCTLEALKTVKNDRLWFQTKIRLAKLHFHRDEVNEMRKILDELHSFCDALKEPKYDLNRDSQLLEIYAVEIQLYTQDRNFKKLKELFEAASEVKWGVQSPGVMGKILECGGKLYLREFNYDKALPKLFDAFRNYCECGSSHRINCLKYIILSNMLMKSEINPFDAHETKQYKNHPEMQSMKNLLAAYQKHDVKEFEQILRENRNIMDDEVICEHIEVLLRNVRTGKLYDLVRHHTSLKMSFIADALNIEQSEVESLLASCIVDNIIKGSIDQVNKVLILKPVNKEESDAKYEALQKLSMHLQAVHLEVIGNMR